MPNDCRPDSVFDRKRESLTVLIPCKNERGNIRACIESIQSIADEILIADSGSTDGTLDIVRGLGGCRIIEREYVNSADFKNWAIPQARNRWVFIVDADERVPGELCAEIVRVLSRPAPKHDAYSCSFVDYFMGHRLKYARWDTESTRLIQRDTCRYCERRVHSNIDLDPTRVGHLRTPIHHLSIWTYSDFIQKYDRYTTWASEELWDKKRRATFLRLLLRPFLRFFFLYVIRGGFLDGAPGLQVCFLMSFFNTFVKQGKLWQYEFGVPGPDPDAVVQLKAPVSRSSTQVSDRLAPQQEKASEFASSRGTNGAPASICTVHAIIKPDLVTIG